MLQFPQVRNGAEFSKCTRAKKRGEIMNWVRRSASRLGLELFDFESVETPGERIHFKTFELFVAVQAVVWSWVWAGQIQQFEAVVRPRGMAEYVDVTFMFEGGTSVANACVLTVCLLLGNLRILPQVFYVLAAASLHLQYVARFSQGSVIHLAHMAGTSVVLLAIAMTLFREPVLRRRFALGSILFFTGWSYVMAAIAKLAVTGPLWVDGRHLWSWIRMKSVDTFSETGVLGYNSLQELALSSVVISTMILCVGLLTEAVGFLLWFRRVRPWVTLACIGLHLGIYLSMNILFHTFIYHLLLIGLPWGRWIDRWIRRTRPDAWRPIIRVAETLA